MSRTADEIGWVRTRPNNSTSSTTSIDWRVSRFRALVVEVGDLLLLETARQRALQGQLLAAT
eukprot:6342473-Pyramimonas_sp.AAC.1